MRIVLTGGGTGGHAYPALSIAEALRAELPDCDLRYIGSKNGIEAELAFRAGIPFSGLTSRQLKKLFSPGAVVTAACLAKGFLKAAVELRRFKPDLVIGTGGYAAAAVVLAQAVRRGKTLIHEQNLIPGRTNRWLSRFASRICVTFEDSLNYFPKGRSVVTGLPVRAELLDLPDRRAAREALEMDPDAFSILILGGSQGAKRLNEVVANSIGALRRLPVQVLHQVGQRNYEEAEVRRRSLNWSGYRVRAYIEDMRLAYGSADLVVSRCGASTVAEITAVGLPAVLVPYPYAYADHQRLNAEFLAKNGAAVVIRESDLTPDVLAARIEQLANRPAELAEMGRASKKLGKPNAARDIAAMAVGMVREARSENVKRKA